MTFAVWIVGLVITLLVLFAIVLYARNSFFIDTDSQVCASQIRGHSALATVSRGEIAPQLNCPTEIVSQQVTDNAEANSLLAEQMVKCWGQWGRGEISLFGRQEGTYCHVCSMITMSGVDEVRGLPAYLDQTQYRKGLTYAQYLAGIETGTVFDEQAHAEASTVSLPATEPLGVVFYHAKGLTGMERAYSVLVGSPARATLVGVVAGGTAGAAGAAGIATVATGVIGTVVGGTVALPVTVVVGGTALLTVAGATVGSALGLTASFQKPELSTMSIVVVRPLNQAEITQLGCQYAPVANS